MRRARPSRHHERKRAPDGRGDWPWRLRRPRFRSPPPVAQSCPAPLADARRLVLVTADTMNARVGDHAALRARIGRRAVARAGCARAGGDRQDRHGLVAVLSSGSRAAANRSRSKATSARRPASIRSAGASAFSLRRGRTIFTSRPTRSASTIRRRRPTTPSPRARASGPTSRAENMSGCCRCIAAGCWWIIRPTRDGSAGSCIFIHVWRSPTTGTAGCVAVPEPRVEALQDFAAGGAVLAILPRGALDRLPGCLPQE